MVVIKHISFHFYKNKNKKHEHVFPSTEAFMEKLVGRRCQRCGVTAPLNTLWKTNMDTETHWFVEENSLPKINFQGPC